MMSTDSRYEAFCCTPVQGSSHRMRNQWCEDSSLCASGVDWCLAAVSDGHGSQDYCRSRLGSWLAICAVEHTVRAMMAAFESIGLLSRLAAGGQSAQACLPTLEREVTRACRAVILRWNNAVEADIRKWPLGTLVEYKRPSEKALLAYKAGKRCERMYGATILAVVVGKGFWFAMQLGDGSIAIREQGKWRLPITPEKLPGEYVHSLCGTNAIGHFQSYVQVGECPEAIMAVTDGIDKAYATYNDQFEFYDKVIRYCVSRGAKRAMCEMQSFLYPISRDGSGDDLAFAGIVRYGPDDTRTGDH